MEIKHIDKIAGGLEPERREGSLLPGVQGTGSPGSQSSSFAQRNSFLDDWGLLRVSSPSEYFSVLFSRVDPSSGAVVNYLQASGEQHYGDHHYNAIAYDLYPVERPDPLTGETMVLTLARKFDITRGMEKCAFLVGDHTTKVISSPILYAGKRRKGERARTIWGIAVDLDDVKPSNMSDIIYWVDKLGIIPMPSMIVSSGGGLHMYYLFPMGVKCYPKTEKLLQRLKHNMTVKLWNPYFSSNKHPQLGQGIWQGFRVPGTPTKDGDKVVGFVPEDIPYYTVKELNKWFRPEFDELIERDNKPLTDEEADAVDNNDYIPSKISFSEAKEKWPDWDPEKEIKGQWVCNRSLYDWWLARLKNHDTAVTTGHRYSCIMALVSFAKKCNIPKADLEHDAYDLVEWLDSLTTDPRNHFNRGDVYDALQLYDQEETARYTKRYLEYHTNIQFRKTKRNGRTRPENLIIARTARDVNERRSGDKWYANNGRKATKMDVRMWCMHHPYVAVKSVCAKDLQLDSHTVAKWWWNGNPKTIPEAVLRWRHDHQEEDNKSLCARECGIDVKTVRKWWNCSAEDAKAEYDRICSFSRKGLEAVAETRKPHDLGAEVNAGYIADKSIAAAVMQNTEGYESQDAETIRKTGDELTDEINYGALNVEELMRSMGFPESVIPIIKADMQRRMATPEFWLEYKKSQPNVDISKWPVAARRAYEMAIRNHEKNK